MTMPHLHLLLNHVPVMGVIFGFLLMIYYLFSKKEEIKKIAYLVFVLSALIMVPTFFSGEKSEEDVEDLPGVSENILKQHEDSAKAAAGVTYLLGALALFGIFFKSSDKAKSNIMISVLILSTITGGLIAKTANLGGQIRHSEIRSGNISIEKQGDKQSQEENADKGKIDNGGKASEQNEDKESQEEKDEKYN